MSASVDPCRVIEGVRDAGIEEGDLIVIRSQKTAAIGDIVVALDDMSQNTLKKFVGFDEDEKAVLAYMNESPARIQEPQGSRSRTKATAQVSP